MIRVCQVFLTIFAVIWGTSAAVSQTLNTDVRTVINETLSTCIAALEADTITPFAEWTSVSTSTPGVYSLYEKFERPGTDFSATFGTRDAMNRCTVVRIGNRAVDRSSEPIDAQIFREFLPDNGMQVGKVAFLPNEKGDLTGCIAGNTYVLRADIAMRTGNAVIALVPSQSENGGYDEC